MLWLCELRPVEGYWDSTASCSLSQALRRSGHHQTLQLCCYFFLPTYLTDCMHSHMTKRDEKLAILTVLVVQESAARSLLTRRCRLLLLHLLLRVLCCGVLLQIGCRNRLRRLSITQRATHTKHNEEVGHRQQALGTAVEPVDIGQRGVVLLLGYDARRDLEYEVGARPVGHVGRAAN